MDITYPHLYHYIASLISPHNIIFSSYVTDLQYLGLKVLCYPDVLFMAFVQSKRILAFYSKWILAFTKGYTTCMYYVTSYKEYMSAVLTTSFRRKINWFCDDLIYAAKIWFFVAACCHCSFQKCFRPTILGNLATFLLFILLLFSY